MASRDGPRATGSDGTDFLHRERVATHYKTSATFKSWLKTLLFLHIALTVLMLFRLSTSFYVMFGMRPPGFLQVLRLPVAEGWEYMWLGSGVAAIFGIVALRKNRQFLMKHSLVLSLVFGLGPVIYAIITLFDDMLQYFETRETKKKFLGFPVIVLWFMFLIVAFQIHCFELYFKWKLIRAWQPRVKKHQ